MYQFNVETCCLVKNAIRKLAVLSPQSLDLIPEQTILHLWWSTWHWDWFYRNYLGFSLSVLVH